MFVRLQCCRQFKCRSAFIKTAVMVQRVRDGIYARDKTLFVSMDQEVKINQEVYRRNIFEEHFSDTDSTFLVYKRKLTQE